MTPAAPIAIVDGRRQILVVDRTGTPRPQTGPQGLLWASWGRHDPTDIHAWPTWSPDGNRLAAFRTAKNGRHSRVWVNDIQGVHGAEVADMGGRVPIILQWSLDGARLAVLSQDSDELVLQIADPRGDVRDKELLRGSPLFFTWVEGRRLAAFIGEGSPTRPRLAVVSPGRSRHELVGAPGNFCAPVMTERGLVYVAHVRGQIAIMVSSLDGAKVRELEPVEGLAALLASPDGRHLARAASPDGTGNPYDSLELLDLDTAMTTPVTERTCVAFFWCGSPAPVSPDSDEPPDGGMVLACTESDATVSWWYVGFDGSERLLHTLVPSRDCRAYLRFFEQYVPSHPIVSPDGTQLVVCGRPPGDDEGPSRVFLVPLDGAPPEELGEGLFASFAPA